MKYDCVVLPQLGGFVKHHVEAHLDECDGVMLPPREVVGFNPQLTINDSLLVQSYVEAYDYSYPEAVSVVEEEVAQLREQLQQDGSYVLGMVGELSLRDNGSIAFEPLNAGIFVPHLYGLAGVDTLRGDSFAKHAETPREEMPENIISINQPQTESDDFVVRIPRRTLRWAVAACVAIMLVASIPFIGRNVNTKQLTGGINLHSLYSLLPKTGIAQDADLSDMEAEEVSVATETTQMADVSPIVGEYTIVLASKVSKANATQFIESLSKENIVASMMPQGQYFRVVTGAYNTMEEARQARHDLTTNGALADAWISRTADL